MPALHAAPAAAASAAASDGQPLLASVVADHAARKSAHEEPRCAPYVVTTATASAAQPSYVVVLLGWLGAKDRALSRFTDLYHALGATAVLRHTAPARDVFLRPERLRALAERTLALLEAHHPNTPVVLAYASNGGCFIHEHLIDVWRQDAARGHADRRFGRVRIAGLIFDSAPAFLTLRAGAAALTGGIKSPLLRAAAFAAAYALLGVAIPCIWPRGRAAQYFRALADDATGAPSLYLFSRADAITDAAPLERFVAARAAARGAPPVVAWCAEDDPAAAKGSGRGSAHVSHFLTYPAAYRAAVDGFLRAHVLRPAAVETAAAPAATGGGKPSVAAIASEPAAGTPAEAAGGRRPR